MFAAGIPDQFWLDALNAVCPAEDVYKIALYLEAEATDKNEAATVYTTKGELPSKAGYTRGGKELSGRKTGLDGKTAYMTFSDPAWEKASFTADAAVIYNSSKENKILAIVSLGKPHTATNGNFTLHLPAPGANGLITIS
jgi:hypothetical protein